LKVESLKFIVESLKLKVESLAMRFEAILIFAMFRVFLGE